jgi:glycosyltransferase involved in cell wall biosynthesis
MRIAWASPVSASSAIARVSADVVTRLVDRGHRVCVIATEWEEAGAAARPMGAEVVTWREAQRPGFDAGFDVLFVNIGDNYAFHAGVFDLMGRWPTVGVFHDFYLHNLFNGWVWDGGRQDEAAQAARHARVVVQTYGETALPLANAARRGEAALSDLATALPMTEWLAASCDGALAHAAYYLGRLRAGCPGPVRQAAMPVSGRGVPPLRPRAPHRLILLTVGVMNPNKCADRVIDALGSSDLGAAVAYHLVGPISTEETSRLRACAEAAGYDGLSVHGAVSDEALQAHLADSDVICCLRDPVLEGSSGSAIEALLAGRPVIVADAGFYRELPDACVCKVEADIPNADLVAVLGRLARDETLRIDLGAAARDWATQHFDLEAYAVAIETLAQETLETRPVLHMARQIGGELHRLGLSPTDPAVERIGTVLADLFPEPST